MRGRKGERERRRLYSVKLSVLCVSVVKNN